MAIKLPPEMMQFLRTEEMRACDDGLNDARASALAAYKGDKYGDEEEGRSQAVTRDVSEVVDFMGVGILGTIMAGGKAVTLETEPENVPVVGPDGQPQVDDQGQPVTERRDYGAEATAAVHYLFMRKQKGYRILHDSLKAGLLEKTGIVRTYAEPRRPLQQTVTVPRAAIEDDGSDWFTVEGLNVVSLEPTDDPAQDDAIALGLMDVSERDHSVVVEVPQAPLIRDEVVPNEWFLVSADTVDLDESPYVGQRTPKSISQLVAMGYDYAELQTLWSSADNDTIVQIARDEGRTQNATTVGPRRDAERLLWFNEEYPLYDLNGDGIAERLYVARVGQTILYVGEVDEQPYSGWSPVPMQHRFTGQSIFDKTGDIQRIRTVLLRQALDSLYQSNAPRTLVPDECVNQDTIDDLLTVRPQALIRYKSAGGMKPEPFRTDDISPTAFQAMEMMSAERESRTGITRQAAGLNPDSIRTDTASGMAMLQQNADQFTLYVTRNFAEMIVASIFGKRYRLMRAHGEPFRMKIDGEYVTIVPSRWPDEIDMQINVGIGTGSKDQRMGFRQMLAQAQQQALVGGLRSVGEQEVYNNMSALIEDAGLGIATDYWRDPSTLGPAPEKVDPATAEAQVQMAKDQQAHEQAMARLQLQQQEQEVSAAIKAQQNEFELAAKRERAALDAEIARQRAIEEARLAQQRADREYELARERMEREFALKRESAANDDADELPAQRPGGSLAE